LSVSTKEVIDESLQKAFIFKNHPRKRNLSIFSLITKSADQIQVLADFRVLLAERD